MKPRNNFEVRCGDARNHLEHIEERLYRKKYLADLGNLKGSSFTFGGMSFDISGNALSIFTGAYEKLLSILEQKLDKVNV